MGRLNYPSVPALLVLVAALAFGGISCDEEAGLAPGFFPGGAGSGGPQAGVGAEGGTQQGFGGAGEGGTEAGHLVLSGGGSAIGQLCGQFCAYVATCEDDPGDCKGHCSCYGISPDGADLLLDFLDQDFASCDEADYWQETVFHPAIHELMGPEERVVDSEDEDDWHWEPVSAMGSAIEACLEAHPADVDI